MTLSLQSSEDEDFGVSGAEDGEEDDNVGSDMGSVDSGAHSRQRLGGVFKRQPTRTQHRAKKWQRQRQRHSSEEDRNDSDEEMGECHCKNL